MADSARRFQDEIAISAQPVTPTIPTVSDYQGLKDHFGPLFEKIATGASHREQHRLLPFAQIRDLNRAGFSLLRVPVEYGGVGASIETFIRLLIDLATADANIAHQYRSHAGFVESLYFLPEQARSYWFSQVLSGVTVGNASTEIGGNTLGTLNTTLQLRPDGTGRLDGTKYYATGSAFSTHTRVSATLYNPDGSVQDGRGFAVVGINDPGVELLDDWDGFGQRLTSTGTATFSAIDIPAAHVLPRVPGSPEAFHEATFFQLVLLAVSAGIGAAAVQDATDGVRGRKRTFNTGLGLPYRQDPLILETVGRLGANAFTARATVVEAAASLDVALAAIEAAGNLHNAQAELPDEFVTAEIAVANAHVTVPELVIKTCSDLFLTGGASNTLRSKNLDRHWRNAQTVATHNPIVFRARAIGDWLVNGTVPEGLNAIGDAPAPATPGKETE
ncbi:acyl-CoA dehydrogenase family protein [Auritidibacter ignavus]|uniref:acyl-CoA dehydrogenase family protein n=1 Tax=Auritidibacter ignavus TaxID=678932 RepID=UPI002447AC7C|nr:acyl-CoA dehydrogenase family protein [Auritidibacter ignavus]WGH82955.1 acyl-CoA dehydrogenase [Auritidibacter ignavus]